LLTSIVGALADALIGINRPQSAAIHSRQRSQPGKARDRTLGELLQRIEASRIAGCLGAFEISVREGLRDVLGIALRKT
jgi:hypothetical protein